MQRFIVSLAAMLFIAVLAHSSASAQGGRTSVRSQDTGHVLMAFDGKEKSATALAYVIEGRLYITGFWLQDSAARYGTDAVASAYVLRVVDKVGEHPIEPNTLGETFFSTLYSAPVGDRAYAIYRSDEKGGSGTVTIHSITDQSIRGSFVFKAYNLDNPTEFRTVTGRFDIPFRTLNR